jgi:predicted nucleic acid-binding Zn ribbon protein
MVYFDVKPLGDLIKEFYELHKGPDYMNEIKVINSWPKVVGPFIASHTIDLSIKNNLLFVRVDSDALRSELSYSKSLLMKNLNAIAGKEVVKEIVLN